MNTFCIKSHYPLIKGLITKRHKKISIKRPIVNHMISLLSSLDLVLTIIVMFAAKFIFLSTSPILFFVRIKIFSWFCKLVSIPYAISTPSLAILFELSKDIPSSVICSPSILSYHRYLLLMNYSPFAFCSLSFCLKSRK